MVDSSPRICHRGLYCQLSTGTGRLVLAIVRTVAANQEAGIRLYLDLPLGHGHHAVLDVGRVGGVVGVARGDRHRLLAVADVPQLDEVRTRHELPHHRQPVVEGEHVDLEVALRQPEIPIDLIQVPESSPTGSGVNDAKVGIIKVPSTNLSSPSKMYRNPEWV